MTRTFIQTEKFSKRWDDLGLDDDALKALKNAVMENVEAGDMIKGLHGARKIRLTINASHGKSGGARVIYLDVSDQEAVYWIFVYTKNRQSNLTSQQKKRTFRNNQQNKGEAISMIKVQVTSTKSKKEIKEVFKNDNLYDDLKEGLNEALDYANGNAREKTKVRKRSLPDINISSLRKELGMTQSAFASILGVSPRTVEAWEVGRTTPSPTAKNLMYLINDNPANVEILKQGNSLSLYQAPSHHTQKNVVPSTDSHRS